MKVKVLWEYLYTHWPHDSSSSSTVLSLSFSLLLYCFKWAQDPLNLVEIKNPFGFFKPTPRLMLSGFTNFYFEKMLSVSAWIRYNIHPSPLPHSRRAVCICPIRVNLYSHWSHPNITPLCIGPLNPTIHQGLCNWILCSLSVCSPWVCYKFSNSLQHNIRPLSRNCDPCATKFAAGVNLRRHDTLRRTVMNVMTIFVWEWS